MGRPGSEFVATTPLPLAPRVCSSEGDFPWFTVATEVAEDDWLEGVAVDGVLDEAGIEAGVAVGVVMGVAVGVAVLSGGFVFADMVCLLRAFLSLMI